MKRSGFKKKTGKPLKKSWLKKKSKVKISVVQRKLWELCRRILKARYTNTCYTCGQMGLVGSNHQAGHLWPKASLGAFLKYDLRVLRPQCFRCNIHLGGNGAVFYSRILKEIGPKAMAKLEADRRVSVKAYDHYLKLIEDYQSKLNP